MPFPSTTGGYQNSGRYLQLALQMPRGVRLRLWQDGGFKAFINTTDEPLDLVYNENFTRVVALSHADGRIWWPKNALANTAPPQEKLMAPTLEERIGSRPAPKVTQQDVDDVFLTWQFHHFLGTTVTVACGTMRNGFTCVGQSACASPENYDEDIGRELAMKDAKRQAWGLLGFRLADQLHGKYDRA